MRRRRANLDPGLLAFYLRRPVEELADAAATSRTAREALLHMSMGLVPSRAADQEEARVAYRRVAARRAA